MEKKVWFKNSKGQKLCGVLHTPEGNGPFPAVVLAHGLSSNKDRGSYTSIAESLLKEKIVTLRIDLYGHGESDGVLADITVSTGAASVTAAVDYLSTLENINKNKIGVFGSSYGGASTIAAASEDPRIKTIVFKAPASDFKQTPFLSQLSDKELKSWEQKGVAYIGNKYTLKWSFYKDVLKTHPDQYSEANKITAPALIIHGDKDTTVPLEHSRKLLESLSGVKKLEIIEGADHRFSFPPDAKERIVKLATDWFSHHLK